MPGPAPLVLLHPFPLDAGAWSPVLDRLRAGGRWVWTPEFPGFGGAPPEDRPGIDGFADRVAAEVAARAPGGRATLCGTSMGGYVALSAAARHAGSVLGLVLAGTRAEPDDPAARAGRAEAAALVRREGTAGFLDGLLPRLLAPGASDAARRAARAMADRAPAEAVARALGALGARADRVPDLPGIAVPVLVVSGAEDRVVPPAVMEALAAALPDAELRTVAGAGHLAALERPEVVAGLVLRFLAGRLDG